MTYTDLHPIGAAARAAAKLRSAQKAAQEIQAQADLIANLADPYGVPRTPGAEKLLAQMHSRQLGYCPPSRDAQTQDRQLAIWVVHEKARQAQAAAPQVQPGTAVSRELGLAALTFKRAWERLFHPSSQKAYVSQTELLGIAGRGDLNPDLRAAARTLLAAVNTPYFTREPGDYTKTDRVIFKSTLGQLAPGF